MSVTVILIVQTSLMNKTAVSDVSVCIPVAHCYLSMQRLNSNWKRHCLKKLTFLVFYNIDIDYIIIFIRHHGRDNIQNKEL